MLPRISSRLWGLAAMVLILTACNRPDLVSDPPTSTPRPLSLEEIETAVVATLVAEGEMTAAARPSDTPTPPEPSPTATNTLVTPTEVPTEVPSCLVVANALNLRYGPGVVYEPPLQTLSAGTVLLPFAKNGDGSWLEVQLEGESTTGWVSAGGQFISCNFDPSGLPQGQIPPTPTPAPTSTPSPTFTPSPTNTPCPELTNQFLTASFVPGSSLVNVTWGSSGGCGTFTGTVTATYEGDPSPYATYDIKDQRGTLTDDPETRCGYTIVYVLTLKDSSGQTVTVSNRDIYWIC